MFILDSRLLFSLCGLDNAEASAWNLYEKDGDQRGEETWNDIDGGHKTLGRVIIVYKIGSHSKYVILYYE